MMEKMKLRDVLDIYAHGEWASEIEDFCVEVTRRRFNE